MKTESINFLKKGSVIFMLLAIFSLSCNKYDDDFKDLNAKIDALEQLVADAAALKAQVADLQASVAGLPALTTSLATIITNITAIQATLATVADEGTATAAVVADLKADLDTLAEQIAADNVSLAAQIDALAEEDADQATQLTALADANTALTAQIAALSTALDNSVSADETTASVIEGLQILLEAQGAQLDILVAQLIPLSAVVAPTYTTLAGQNTVTVTLTGGTFKSGAIVAGDFTITGGESAKIIAGSFVRTSSTVVTITTAILEGSTANNLTVLAATLATQATSVNAAGSVIVLAVLSPPFDIGESMNNVIFTLENGTFKTGVSQSDLTFAGTDAAALTAGTVTYLTTTTIAVTVAAPLTYVATNNTLTVKTSAILALTGGGILSITISDGSLISTLDVISPLVSSTAGHTLLTITLTGGTYKAGAIAATDFTFTGTNAAAIAAGTFTRVSDVLVYVSGIVDMVASIDNAVTVKAATMATNAASVAIATEPAPVDIISAVITTTVGHIGLTITLTGGAYKTGAIVATDFTFTGTNAVAYADGVFVRTSDTVVTIYALTLAVSEDDAVTVKGATQLLPATSVAIGAF